MAITDPHTPLPDIEAAIRDEVADINSRRPVRPVATLRQTEQPALPQVSEEQAFAPTEPNEPVPLPMVLAALAHRIDDLDERMALRLARIERALGIT